MNPLNNSIFERNEENRKKLLVLGNYREGKSCFCRHCTGDDVFKISSINHSVTKEFTIGRGGDYICMDTPGFGDEDHPSQTILKKILEGLHTAKLKQMTLDAICLIIDMSKGFNAQTMKNQIAKLKFITKSNLILILTKCDYVITKAHYEENLKIFTKFAEEVLDKHFKEKMVLWINNCPDDEEHKESVQKHPKKKYIYDNQFKKLEDAIKLCEIFTCDQIEKWHSIQKKLFLKKYFELISNPNINRIKNIVDYELEFNLKFDEKGELKNCSLNKNTIIGASAILISSTLTGGVGAWALSTLAFPIIITTSSFGGLFFIGSAIYFGKKYFDSKKAKMELEESKCYIKNENVSQTIIDIFKEKGIDQIQRLIYIEKDSISNDNLSISLDENGNNKAYSLIGTKFIFSEQQDYYDEEMQNFKELSVNRESDEKINISVIKNENLKNSEKIINLRIKLELWLPESESYHELIWKEISPETEKEWKKIIEDREGELMN